MSHESQLLDAVLNLRQAAELLIDCAYCKAKVEYRCRTRSGGVAEFAHSPRRRWAFAVQKGTQSPYFEDEYYP